MTDRARFAAGSAAILAAMLCCLASVLLVATGMLGASVFAAVSIYILSPVVLVCLAVLGYLLSQERRHSKNNP
jgi:multisubunit Na+/H+ antiporter MnhG subunit